MPGGLLACFVGRSLDKTRAALLAYAGREESLGRVCSRPRCSGAVADGAVESWVLCRWLDFLGECWGRWLCQ